MLIFGPHLLEMMGGRGNVLAQAVSYVQIFFGGAILPWLMNSMAGILRGTGNMKLPSAHVPQFGVLPDRARRLARPRPWADPAIRHARRRCGLADRLYDQRSR